MFNPFTLEILRRKGFTNPLRLDPTRTGLIRDAFRNEVHSRFAEFQSRLELYLSTNPGLLFSYGSDPIGDPFAQRIHTTDAEKLEEFDDWYKQTVEETLLQNKQEQANNDWIYFYLALAYDAGVRNATVGANGEDYLDVALPIFRSMPSVQEDRRNTLALLTTRTRGVLVAIGAALGASLLDSLSKGMLSKSSIEDIRQQMLEEAKAIEKKRANAMVESEVIRAHAEAQLDAFQNSGVTDLKILVEWTTAGDNRVCPLCEAKAGTVYTVEQARGLIPYHVNCVTGSTQIVTPNALAVTRAHYFGKLFKFITTTGKDVTCSEHHILLTSKGWRFAKDIAQGDYLLNCTGLHSTTRPSPDQDKIVPGIEDVFCSLFEAFPEYRTPIARTRPEDFHGDGPLFKEKIDVVDINGVLRNGRGPKTIADGVKISLMPGGFHSASPLELDGLSDFSTMLLRLASASDSFVCSESVLPILSRTSFGSHESVGSGAVSERNFAKPQSGSDHISSTPMFLSDLIDRHPGGIQLDKVCKIQVIEPVRGGVPVFDVFTHESVYLANGLLSSNCRCSWIPA